MKGIRFFAAALAVTLALSGCAAQKPATVQIFAMDTLMSFTAYGDQAQQALTQASQAVAELEDMLSVTRPDSEVSAINTAGGEWVNVSEPTYMLLAGAKRMGEATGGALDVTAYPAVKAWGFTTGEYRVPRAEELEALCATIDHTAIELHPRNLQVRLPAGMELDFGAVAKGYAGYLLRLKLLEAGVESASLSLGGNVQTVGAKPDGSPWRVGIQDPEGDGYLARVEVIDQAVVTSGGYQRYFEENGEIYWHIIDPHTAAPARSDVRSATIVGADGTVCDGLSTALFVLGSEKAAQLWRNNQGPKDLDFEYILVLADGSVHITQGLEDCFALADGYTDRKVTVIAP